MSKKDKIEQYPILPLRNTVLFPQQIIPIYVGREQSLELVESLKESKNKHIVDVLTSGTYHKIPPNSRNTFNQNKNKIHTIDPCKQGV